MQNPPHIRSIPHGTEQLNHKYGLLYIIYGQKQIPPVVIHGLA
jgi:hypothetical protein